MTGKLHSIRPAENAAWLGVLERCAQYDFYHLPEYHDLEERRGQGTAWLFAYEEAGCTIALPLLLRSLRGIPGVEGLADGCQDATSVYGYTGPICSHTEAPPAVVRHFHAALQDALTSEGVVAVFSRLHPLIPQYDLLAGLGEYAPLGETVSLDLTLPVEAQWQLFRDNHKRGIAKLAKLGVTCVEDEKLEHLAGFVDIYLETMQRVGAEGIYLFDREYFEAMSRQLGQRHHLFVAMHEGELVGGGVFIECRGIVQFHLGGTRTDYLKLAPMKLIFDAVRRWASAQGHVVLHFGGGVGSQEDSLFHFKAGFSDRRHRFARWRWVVDPAIYQGLCDAKDRWNEARGLACASPGYFPAYRALAVPIEASQVQ